MFGTQDTANVLTKLTTGFAIAFGGLCIIISLFLSHPSENQQKSMLKDRADKRQDFSPVSALQGQQSLPLAPQGGAKGAAQPNQGVQQGLPQGLPLQQPSGGLPVLPQAPAEKKAK